MGSGYNKVDKLFDEYLNFVSSNEESESFLKENGLLRATSLIPESHC